MTPTDASPPPPVARPGVRGAIPARGGVARLAALFAAVALLAACREPQAPPHARAADAVPTTAATAAITPTTPMAAATLDALCLYEVRVEALSVDDRALDGAVVGRAVVARLLDDAERGGPFAGVAGPARAFAADDAPTCAADAPATSRTGLAVGAALAALDADGAPTTMALAVAVGLRATAHAERGDARGRAVVGEATVEAPLPPPHDRGDDAVERFANARAVAALALAGVDAGGQLLARERSDADIAAWLDDDAPWRRVAALREVGERALADLRPRVEALAATTRPDVAAVAAATLGRLADRRSVAALRTALAASAVEIADAALLALADIGGDDALAAIAAAAAEHPQAWIRQRARGLLERRRGPPAARAAEEEQR